MQVMFGGAAAARLAEWRRRAESLDRSFLDVWARPAQIAVAIFGVCALAVVAGQSVHGSSAVAIQSGALILVLGLALGGRLMSRDVDVMSASAEIARRNHESASRLAAAVDGLPEETRREIREEGARVFHGADGIAVILATGLALLAAIVAAVPAASLAASLAPQVPFSSLIAALVAPAIVLPVLVRLVVATTAETTRVRTALVEELSSIVEEGIGRRRARGGPLEH